MESNKTNDGGMTHFGFTNVRESEKESMGMSALRLAGEEDLENAG